jgi:hypothetical protein
MKNIIISAIYLLILFCLSAFVFDPAHLYYEIWWLDIPMHILGGFGVASLVGAVLHYKGQKVSYKRLFLGYIIVAVVWEIYEYVHALPTLIEWGGWFDTVKDLVDGAIGMSIAYLFVKKRN